jgi:Mg2+-importing ATPase
MQNFGSIDILCSDKTGTLTSGNMVLSQVLDPGGQAGASAFALAYLNSYYETGIKNPLDRAILNAVTKDSSASSPPETRPPDVGTYRKIDEIPFDFERRRLSIVVEHNGMRMLITKGAPESVVAACAACDENGRRYPLDTQGRARCAGTYLQASARGYRVLAVAYRSVPPRDAYRIADEADLVLAGFLTFSDPALEDAADALRDLRRDGVRVMILTGDNDLVAHHVCSQVGLDGARVVLGDAVDRMSDGALAHAAEQTTVFARVSPAQKNRIMLALKARGHVVAFLGDGINDAPSLYAADVGISVSTGVDVAKDAADVVLLERSLRVLHTGIIEGRKAFGNVMKYLLMGTSSNFGNMFSMAAASAFLPFLPMLPTQILVNNFLYDLSQVTIPTDTVDPTFILKPRRWNIALIRNFMVFIGPISSLYDFLTFGALLTIFHSGEVLFHTGWFVESLATQTLVIFVIRTAGNPLRSRPSLPLTVSGLAVVTMGLLLPYTPLAALLGLTPMPVAYFPFLAGVTATYLLLVEFGKRRLMAEFLA